MRAHLIDGPYAGRVLELDHLGARLHIPEPHSIRALMRPEPDPEWPTPLAVLEYELAAGTSTNGFYRLVGWWR
jgi:hypothetical protein